MNVQVCKYGSPRTIFRSWILAFYPMGWGTELRWSGSVASAFNHPAILWAPYFLSFSLSTTPVCSSVSLSNPLPPSPFPLCSFPLVVFFFSSTLYPFSQEMAPAIDWLSCLQATFTPMSLSPAQTLVVRDLDYLRNMSQLVEEELLTSRFAQVELDRYWAWKE